MFMLYNETPQYNIIRSTIKLAFSYNKDTYRTNEPLKKPPIMVRSMRFMTIMHP